jgi:hypothetical protein
MPSKDNQRTKIGQIIFMGPFSNFFFIIIYIFYHVYLLHVELYVLNFPLQ